MKVGKSGRKEGVRSHAIARARRSTNRLRMGAPLQCCSSLGTGSTMVLHSTINNPLASSDNSLSLCLSLSHTLSHSLAPQTCTLHALWCCPRCICLCQVPAPPARQQLAPTVSCAPPPPLDESSLCPQSDPPGWLAGCSPVGAPEPLSVQARDAPSTQAHSQHGGPQK